MMPSVLISFNNLIVVSVDRPAKSLISFLVICEKTSSPLKLSPDKLDTLDRPDFILI